MFFIEPGWLLRLGKASSNQAAIPTCPTKRPLSCQHREVVRAAAAARQREEAAPECSCERRCCVPSGQEKA